MPGPPPKATGRQRTNSPAAQMVARPHETGVDVAPAAPPAPPPPPAEYWTDVVAAQWEQAWRSELASFWLSATDLATVTRCFDLRHRIAQLEALVYSDPDDPAAPAGAGLLVPGSTGQLIANPLMVRADAMRDDLLALEDRLGLSPAARLRLGVRLGEAAASLAAMNRLVDDAPVHPTEAGAPVHEPDFSLLTVKQLRGELTARNRPSRGRKSDLIERLKSAIAAEETDSTVDMTQPPAARVIDLDDLVDLDDLDDDPRSDLDAVMVE